MGNTSNKENFCLSIGNDIWIEIFSHIDIPNLPNLSLVCKDFNEIFKNQNLWKRKCIKMYNLLDKELIEKNQVDFYKVVKNGIFYKMKPEHMDQVKKNLTTSDKAGEIDYKLSKFILRYDYLPRETIRKLFGGGDFIVKWPKEDVKCQIWGMDKNYNVRDNTFKFVDIIFSCIDVSFLHKRTVYYLCAEYKRYAHGKKICFIFHDYENCQKHDEYIKESKKEIDSFGIGFCVFEILPKVEKNELFVELMHQRIIEISQRMLIFFSIKKSPESLETYHLLSKKGSINWSDFLEQEKLHPRK